MSQELKQVNKPIRKKDAINLLLGKPVYVDDVTPHDCLIVKLVHSPHANALIENIDTEAAKAVDTIEAVYTYKDVPQKRFTMAGQTYPEPSPYDRLILDQRVRFVGDPVAIVAGYDEKKVDEALKLIKVKYQVEEAVLDFKTAKDNPILVHPEDNWKALCPVGADNKRNLVATADETHGDLEEVFKSCDHVIERTYHVPAVNQAMMETFRTYCEIDTYGRLHVISSTQIVFHARRILANALDIPKSMIRVEKPRIGGGFGAKQSLVTEIYPAFVTWMTKKPSKLIYTRTESQIAGSPRHEMEVTTKVGAMNDGTIRAIDVYTLSNSGAFGEHGPTTVGLSGHKSIPLYTNNLEAFRFHYDVVYTNRLSSGAYRGYGATQGIYALETCVNELADILHMDPVEIREKNMVRQGQKMDAYYGEIADSCALDKCMERAKKEFDWENRKTPTVMPDGRIKAAGVAMAMQGSGISGVDVGSATLKLNDDGSYMLSIGAADMGTGCDTILAQMAAEELECDVDNIVVFGADTDASPYDSGSYASSTTYVTGMAVRKTSEELKENMMKIAANKWECDPESLVFTGNTIDNPATNESFTHTDIATFSQCGNTVPIQVTCTHSSKISPPPYMVGMAEIALDKDTGSVEILDYVAVVDCGTVVNTNLATVQTEGGLVQGIGMALSESITYSPKGGLTENNFMTYKIPTRLDMGHLRVYFESSYEKTGPFGAKSIGECVINTPAPALCAAIHSACGAWVRDLPMTPEKIVMAIDE